MHRLVRWSAKRSGPCMVVRGLDVDRKTEVKLTSVYEVKRDEAGRTFALDGVGNRMAYLD